MRKYLIRCLIFHNAAVLSLSCNPYNHLQKNQTAESCILKFKPDFKHVLYRTSVDVTGKHISGLLLIKYMPDSSTRIAFSNEAGFSFFDFGFEPDHGFRVYQITPKMNNKALIKTLRKDFELILFRNMNSEKYYSLTDGSLIYHAYPQSKGVNYYITDTLCSRLVKMQRASNKKPIMEAFWVGNSVNHPPDSILIHHLNFRFTIALKKITALAPE